MLILPRVQKSQKEAEREPVGAGWGGWGEPRSTGSRSHDPSCRRYPAILLLFFSGLSTISQRG